MDIEEATKEIEKLRKKVTDLERENMAMLMASPQPIVFIDDDLTGEYVERRLEWDEGDPSVGVQSGYIPAEPHPDTTKAKAAIAYAGLVSDEVAEIMGIAQAHGFAGWPDHVGIGYELRSTMGLEHQEIIQLGKEALEQFKSKKKAEAEKSS